MAELTVTEALVRLKLQEKKIGDAINSTKIGCMTVKAVPKLPSGFTDVEIYKKAIDADLDRVNGLIRNRNNLKNAIVTSNAKTIVKIGKEEMTVAEAIERKRSIEHDKQLLNYLRGNVLKARQQVDAHNASLPAKADAYVNQAFANDNTPNVAENKMKGRESWLAANEVQLLTSSRMDDIINSLAERIESFESEVDTQLSVANAKTIIQVAD